MLSQTDMHNKKIRLLQTKADGLYLVGVAGFEPAASWTRTMRDTKLRHTPIA